MLTIGISFHNNRDTLGDAIRSVYAQTFEDWQLVLVDDGSTDGSLDLARSIEDTRVHVISDGCNRGLASRLNQIAAVAAGEWLARMDADDLMHPDRLRRQVELLQRDASLDLVDTGLLSIDGESLPTGKRCCDRLELSREGLIRGRMPVHASVVARTAWYRAHRYDTTLSRAQDFELWNRAFAAGELSMQRIPEPLYLAREGVGATYWRTSSTYAAKRRTLRLYGRQAVGLRQTGAEIAKCYVKQAVYFGAGVLAFDKQLIAKRNIELTRAEMASAAEVIRAVQATNVPGMCSATKVHDSANAAKGPPKNHFPEFT